MRFITSSSRVWLAAAVGCLSALAPSSARAHAALLKSDPRAGSTVSSTLGQVRLEFSEEVVPDLCHVAIVTPGGESVDLKVTIDPRDAKAIVAPLSDLSGGVYRVNWHVVSADGHPSSGSFTFTVAAPVIEPQTVARAPALAVSVAANDDFPRAAAIFRGIGVSALLALAGILFFSMGHGGARTAEYEGAIRAFALTAFVALLIHLVLWDRYVMPTATFGAATWQAMLSSLPGKLELLRMVVVAVVALLVLLGAGAQLLLGASGLAIVITGAIGHPIATTPAISIPVVILHLIAVAVWLGGILSLLILRKVDAPSYLAHARNVSRLALIAAIIVTVTGTVQSVLLLTALTDLISTAYGELILVKCAGLALLIGMGAYHRFRSIPRLSSGTQSDMVLSLRYEIAVMAGVIVVAAFLSYTQLPR